MHILNSWTSTSSNWKVKHLLMLFSSWFRMPNALFWLLYTNWKSSKCKFFCCYSWRDILDMCCIICLFFLWMQSVHCAKLTTCQVVTSPRHCVLHLVSRNEYHTFHSRHNDCVVMCTYDFESGEHEEQHLFVACKGEVDYPNIFFNSYNIWCTWQRWRSLACGLSNAQILEVVCVHDDIFRAPRYIKIYEEKLTKNGKHRSSL